MNSTVMTEERVEQIEKRVERIMDDIVDGNGPEDIMEELDGILKIVGSTKTAEELTPY